MPNKPKTIKPVMAWAVANKNGNLFPQTYRKRDFARERIYMNNIDAEVIRVEIRDAATAKLERAALDALLMYSRTNRQQDLDEAKAHAAKILEVRRG